MRAAQTARPAASRLAPLWIGRALREPVLHFLLGGALLFGLYAAVGPAPEAATERIVVSAQQVANLAAVFERTWLRPPSEDELAGLVDDFVTEEVLYREALALGLDRDDPVVRQRMRQKMDFLAEELAAARAPTDAELARYLAEHAERFREPARFDFAQVRVATAGDVAAADARARALLARLRDGGAAGVRGDPSLLPAHLADAPAPEIEARFGDGFARELAGTPLGAWTGPIASAFGLHLVRVDARTPARLPALAEIRARVEGAWEAEARRQRSKRFHARLRERYAVEVRMPASADPAPALASQAP